MRIIEELKDLKTIGQTLIAETNDVKKKLDTVKFELAYAQFVAEDIKKDVAEYQFQTKPRIEAIKTRADKIQNELSK